MRLTFVIPLLIILVGVQIFGTYLATPLAQNNMTAFGDPQNVQNPFEYLGAVIVMTGLVLLLYKIGWGKVVTAFMMLSVWSTLVLVVATFTVKFFGFPTPLYMDIATLVIPTVGLLLIWKYPEWYVVDIIGFFLCAGIAAVIGASFGIIPILILLVIFAVYDAVSVYKTKHMQRLAELVLTNKLPVLFVIPTTRDFSFREKKEWTNLDDREARPAHILGMGDIVIPSALVVSASLFVGGGTTIGMFTTPAIGAMVGSVVGLLLLNELSERYPTSHAGLPLLNFCTILGFAILFFI